MAGRLTAHGAVTGRPDAEGDGISRSSPMMMTGAWRRSVVCTALLALPLASPLDWIEWGYRGLARHEVTRSAAGLRVSVNHSAGAIAYRLQAPVTVTGLSATGRLEGRLAVTGPLQGQPGHDDYALRVGLVTKGDRRLGFFQRRLAPAWVRTLHDMAPAGSGISDVQFFNLGVEGATLNRQRRHPLHELLRETVVAVPCSDGTFSFTVALNTPVEVLGIWIGTDGDDTRSTFTLLLTSLTLDGVEAGPGVLEPDAAHGR